MPSVTMHPQAAIRQDKGITEFRRELDAQDRNRYRFQGVDKYDDYTGTGGWNQFLALAAALPDACEIYTDGTAFTSRPA